jgi:hypothetical protein
VVAVVRRPPSMNLEAAHTGGLLVGRLPGLANLLVRVWSRGAWVALQWKAAVEACNESRLFLLRERLATLARDG